MERTNGQHCQRHRPPAPSSRCVGSTSSWRSRVRRSPIRTGAVAPPKAPKRLPKTISITHRRLLSAASVGDTPAALRDRAIVEVLYGSGARIGEAVGLDVDDIDLGRKLRQGSMGKGSQEDRSLGSTLGRPSRHPLYSSVHGDQGQGDTRPVSEPARGAAHPAECLDGDPCGRRTRRTRLITGQASASVEHLRFTPPRCGRPKRPRRAGEPSRTPPSPPRICTRLVTIQRLREVYAGAHPRAR